ncbi:phospholipase D family protein [soil metagenome]
MRRMFLWSVLGLLSLVAIVFVVLLVVDHLTPPATGAPSHALALQPAQTQIDRELAPLLAAHPGKTGVVLVTDGLDAFATRALAARKAGRSLDLQYYIWHDDMTGRLLAREVHAAAQRGVRVRILLDDLNAEGIDPQLMALDAHPNIELRLYNPFRNRQGPARLLEMVHRAFSLNYRMHNKAWIADGRVAIVGGRNIGEAYFSADAQVNFRDLDLLLFGPAVQQASTIFDAYWNSAAAVPMAALSRKSPEMLRQMLASADMGAVQPAAKHYLDRVAQTHAVHDYYQRALTPRWSAGVSVVADPPLKGRDGDHRGWLVHRLVELLGTAHHKALVVSPYFVPGEGGTAVLEALADRGVETGVITNSLAATDVPAVHGGYARYRGTLLEHGVHLYEIKARGNTGSAGNFGSSGASLHTKAFTVDDARGFVGSFNLDPRSIALNTEMGVLFDDPAIAIDVRNEYLRLAEPDISYWVYRTASGELRWLDRLRTPPVVLRQEPDTTAWRRGLVRVLSWLPIESQL